VKILITMLTGSKYLFTCVASNISCRVQNDIWLLAIFSAISQPTAMQIDFVLPCLLSTQCTKMVTNISQGLANVHIAH